MMLTQAALDTIVQDYIQNKSRLSDRQKFTLPIFRFFTNIRVNIEKSFDGSPCWEWQGSPHPVTGYCEMVIDGRRGRRKKSSPHRFAYLYFIGDLPEGLEPDHLCENRICASPLHLEMVSHRENCRRRGERQLTCKRGHLRIPENIMASGKCRACNREDQKLFQERKRNKKSIQTP